MANKTIIALIFEQYKEIINTMRAGGSGFRPNDRKGFSLKQLCLLCGKSWDNAEKNID